MAATGKKCDSSRPAPQREYIIRPRDRKERKHYTDDWALGDEEIEGRRSFRLEDKIETDRFPQCFVKEMKGEDFNLAYLQRHGFNTPLLFREKTGLGLRVPSANFSVNDVRMCVGSRRILDVMDVNTQKNVEMTMREWQRYYDDPEKDRLLNVISLEFSHTKLENYIQTPTVVRQIDWVDCVWPRHLKEAQTESTNVLDDMMYPKVQKYCLMSVKGCYTDFHVDFGGTSIFWLIPPTEKNLHLYEQWVLSGKQADVFFGDTVEKCGRVTLTAGNTFFIPTGWIHAVFTPCDSLVFGGNFLHSYGIEKQLKTAQVEDTTHRYVHCLLGRSHLDEGGGGDDGSPPRPSPPEPPKPDPSHHIHLTPQELHGLKAIVMFLHSLPTNKKNVPELIRDPIALIKDVRTLVEQHRYDNPEAAVTGRPILRTLDDPDKEKSKGMKMMMKNSMHRGMGVPGKHKAGLGGGSASGPGKGRGGQGPRRRRTRCKKCEACQRQDCGECSFCMDMVKFGGPGRAKQTCVMRQCLQPMLPITAACVTCGLDGWGQEPVVPIQKTNRETASSLMECSVCYEIIHPDCIAKQCPDSDGIVNEDLPNSWECPKCCKDGKNIEYKPRHFRARQKSSEVRRMSVSSDTSSMVESKDHLSLPHMGSTAAVTAVSAATPTSSSLPATATSSTATSSASPSPGSTAVTVKQEMQEGIDGEDMEGDASSVSNSGTPKSSYGDGPIPLKRPKLEPDASPGETKSQWEDGTKTALPDHASGIKGSRSPDSQPQCSGSASASRPNSAASAPNGMSNASSEPRKLALRTHLAHQMSANSNKTLRRPQYVVRPAGGQKSGANGDMANGDGCHDSRNGGSGSNPALDRNIILPVFQYLSPADLARCAAVCRLWSKYSIDPSLWRRMNLSHNHLTAAHLTGVVRRQPEALRLDWTNVPKRQLVWLIARLPQMRELSLQGCTWSGVSALRTCVCPPLTSLDLSYVTGFNDGSLREILSPPPDSRPGLVDSKSRVRSLRILRLAGCDISDVAFRYVTQHLPLLETLDVSSCQRVTDAGVAQLATPPAATIETLVNLDLSNCRHITDSSLEHLARCEGLKRVDLRHTPNVTAAAVAKLAVRHELKVMDAKLIAKRPV
ncbi:JmjC domain-containing histone demethylation protein 1 [Gryllus bimaculatus]|nr:JmjC domain-containing histone demethylation protein 1 [Gryllus bimaculatus]